jgi:hypothetical protein
MCARSRDLLKVLTVASGSLLTGLVDATAQPASVPAAKLTEVQVASTVPMGAAAVDLAAAGYTEREFYADGIGNRYRGALPGALGTAEIIDGNWPYRSRVLVVSAS